ncbi:MAG: hypothetical protein LBP35_01935 [Candidatus Ancillula trichonymphae]|nr:hypothetical protein [Candidatus Ancillula trichonymphae]
MTTPNALGGKRIATHSTAGQDLEVSVQNLSNKTMGFIPFVSDFYREGNVENSDLQYNLANPMTFYGADEKILGNLLRTFKGVTGLINR